MKNLDRGLWRERLSINDFPIQVLLPKFKEERTEEISRLLSTFVTHKLQEHLNLFSIHFLNFFNTFQYLFHNYDVTSLENILSITFWKCAKRC